MLDCSHILVSIAINQATPEKAEAARSGITLLVVLVLLLIILVVGVLLVLAFHRHRPDTERGEPTRDLDAWRSAGERAEPFDQPPPANDDTDDTTDRDER